MLENRPIVAITIGYIIGIIMGLYCNISIVFLYLLFTIIYLIIKNISDKNTQRKKQFKLVSIRRYRRYFKIIFTKNVCILICISSVVSNTITTYKNMKIDEFLNRYNGKEIHFSSKVVSNDITKKYNKKVIIKFEGKHFYLKVKKNTQINYGDTIIIKGTFIKPKKQTNYKGFNYLDYYKSQGIFGTINATSIEIIDKEDNFFNTLFLNIKDLIQRSFSQEISNVLMGTILGDKENLDEEIREEFSESNVSHILAISGMHVGYLIYFCFFILKKEGKRNTYFISIFVILFYYRIIGFSVSIARAIVMTILSIVSKILYRKNDLWTTLGFSTLCLLIYNPFIIKSVSFILSFTATFGIIEYNKLFYKKSKIINAFLITIILNIFLIPIYSVCFYKIPILSISISIIAGIIVGPIFIFGIIYILLGSFINLNILKIILEFLVKVLLFIIKIGSKMPLNKIYVYTPNALEIIFYYIIFFVSIFLFSIYKQKRIKNKTFIKRVKNLISLLKYRYKQYKKRIISIFIICIIFFTITELFIIPKNLKIYFIDVGQGDSCLIVTPNNKKILIDGGGNEDFDVGKNILIPYLLARKIKNLDYIIISHFDTDHVRGNTNCYGGI